MPNMRINAQPSKSLFIDMLRKDIALIEPILDLADNSIDSLMRRHNRNVMDILQGTADDFIRATVRKERISSKCFRFCVITTGHRRKTCGQ